MTFEPAEFHGLPAVRWQSRDGARAVATLQGAQLVSWTPASGEECLYVSERSAFEAGRPVRGGIPVCFPQFADLGPLALHGFARTLSWRFMGSDESGDGASVSFALESSPQTEALWPGNFRLELVATIGGPRLRVHLRVVNTGRDTFAFTGALHTYLRISHAENVRLEGLRGVRYVDRGETAMNVEAREIVTAAEPIDRAYFSTPPVTRLEDAGRSVRIEQRGFTDTVAWNPGRERTAQMPDMPPEGFLRMLCVEAAAIDPPVTLAPGAAWAGSQAISVSSESTSPATAS